MLCPNCIDNGFACVMGNCKECNAEISSGTMLLCGNCSTIKTECESCRHPLTPEWIEKINSNKPKTFQFLMAVVTTTEEIYTVEADSEEEAKELAESGEVIKTEKLGDGEVLNREVLGSVE